MHSASRTLPTDSSSVWLVAEDSDDDFFLFARACSRLNPAPYLHRAKNGVEAQHYLAGDAPFNNREAFPVPTLVVSDLKMPLMDGLQFLKWFKDRATQIPFVFLTGSDAQSDRNQAADDGADEYLVKPGAFEELAKTIAGVWARH